MTPRFIKVLPFPSELSAVPNVAITSERIALVNAIGTAINGWLADNPLDRTREVIEWALDVVRDGLVDQSRDDA